MVDVKPSVELWEYGPAGAAIWGRVTLGPNGIVMDDGARSFLSDYFVVEPDTLVPLTPDDGERYIRALPSNLRGTYVWARLIAP